MKDIAIKVNDLTVKYNETIIMQNVDFSIYKGDIFIIMAASGGGKSTLLRVLTGLKEPASGNVIISGVDFWNASVDIRSDIMQKNGILYQSGALFSSMTLAENVAMPLQQYSNYSGSEIEDIVNLKLALVGLGGYRDFYPSEISGGMKKRAGLARALALDPEIVYFDEPSAGLDPISARNLDDLILEINQSLGTTIVVVTHELASIFAIGNNSIFLDVKTKTGTGFGDPNELLRNPPNNTVLNFLTRGEKGNEKNS